MNRVMKHLIAVALAGLIAWTPPPANAQIAVIDAANLGQNTLAALRMLQAVNNQLVQLQNEAQMLINEARNLTTLPFNIVAQLQATLATTTQLIQQAQGITYQLQTAQSRFNTFYPFGYGPAVSGASMAFDSFIRWSYSLQALQTNIGMQAQAATNLDADSAYLAALVGQSQGAVGILQAAQATNQLLALHSRQAIQEQQLRVASDRSAALELARTVAAEARSREVRRRFVGSGTPYTPQSVNFYGF
jgi:P-type conjugative transfer protein TrbJ